MAEDGRTGRRGGPIASTLRFVRARDWVHFLPLPWVYATAGTVLSTRLAIAAVAAAACLAYAYGLNQWLDTELTRGRAREEPDLSRGVRIAILVVSGVAALACAALLGRTPLVAAALSLVGGHVYSAWPRLKAIPLVGTLGNAWIFGPLAFLGAGIPDGPPAAPWLAAAFVALLLQNQLIHEAAHRSEDAQDGILTTFVRWGTPVGATLQVVFGCLAAAALARAGWAAGVAAVGVATGVAAMALTVGVALSGWTSATGRAHRVRNIQRWIGLAVGACAWLGCLLPGTAG